MKHHKLQNYSINRLQKLNTNKEILQHPCYNTQYLTICDMLSLITWHRRGSSSPSELASYMHSISLIHMTPTGMSPTKFGVIGIWKGIMVEAQTA